MQSSTKSPMATLPEPRGLSLLEVLVTLTVLAVLTALTGGALTTLASWRGLGAIQELAAVLDEARAQAMATQQEVWVAFATTAAVPGAFRSYVQCEMTQTPDGEKRLRPIGDWRRLPQGQVFSLSPPATPEAGRNLLREDGALRPVWLAGVPVEMPCLGFGVLGQIVHPSLNRPLLALAEGDIHHGLPLQRQGPGPEPCRWLALHRHTGNALLLP